MKNMTATQLEAVDGGALPFIIPMIAGAAIGAIISGWSDFKEGFQTAYDNQRLAE